MCEHLEPLEGLAGLQGNRHDVYALPVAGGLLFGTQVGAAILFLEKLMGGGIDEASQKRYQITGSWEEPVITPLDTDKQSEKSTVSPAQKPADKAPGSAGQGNNG